MKLLSKEFKYSNDIQMWYGDNLELCDDTLCEFVDIPEDIRKIEIVLSTKLLSKHSLILQNTCNTGGWNHILVDNEKINVTPVTKFLLEKYWKKHDKLFATIYYSEKRASQNGN